MFKIQYKKTRPVNGSVLKYNYGKFTVTGLATLKAINLAILGPVYQAYDSGETMMSVVNLYK